MYGSAHSLHYAHKLTTTRCASLRNRETVAPKVLVWTRGRLATLQSFTSFSLPLEETHGSSGQCVSETINEKESFSLIDVGSAFTAYLSFFSLQLMMSLVPYESGRNPEPFGVSNYLERWQQACMQVRYGALGT